MPLQENPDMSQASRIFLSMGSCILFFSVQSIAQQNLVLIGGGSLQTPALERLGTLAGGAKGKILVIPWASSSGSEAFGGFESKMQSVLADKCPKLFSAKSDRESLESYDLVADLQNVSGVFFTGGNQNELMKALSTNSKWIPLIKSLYEKGIVFGGTSAGTAVMTETMITGSGDETVIDPNKVVTADGLGLLTGVLVDQHFIKRQRENRVFSLLLREKECFAFGIDEKNAVYVQDGTTAEVLGPGIVMTIDRCRSRDGFHVDLKEVGARFQLK